MLTRVFGATFFVIIGGFAANASGQQILLGQGFEGPALRQGCKDPPFDYNPPDPTIAVSSSSTSNRIVVTTNSFLYVYDKTSLAMAGFMSLEYDPDYPQGLFSSFGAEACPVFDPRVLYDHYHDTFVVAALNPYRQHIFHAGTAPGADPAVFSSWNTTMTTRDFGDPGVDFTGLGFDQEYYYVTVRVPGGALIRAFPWNAIGGPYYDVEVTDAISTIQPAVASGSPPYGYFVEAARTSSTTTELRVFAWDRNIHELTANSPVHLDISPPWTDPLYVQPQCSQYGLRDPQGYALRNCIYWKAGDVATLHVGHAVWETAQANQVQWYDIDLGNWPVSGQPTVTFGTFAAATATFMPSIARAHQELSGQSYDFLAMVVGTAGVGVPPGMGVAGRKVLPLPPTPWSDVQNVKTGVCALKIIRWGDYFGIAVDPDPYPDGGEFWAIGEYLKPAITEPYWGTWIQNFAVRP
ncbi:MAG: hypothetical protein AB1486_34450 [Planctomycetota bacterium]